MEKQIAWASKTGRALMGKVTEETEAGYIAEVTSYESKKDKNMIGKKFFVRKEYAKVL
jgi:electron transfer flavoprotein alpha subunit